jgi:hypothetical protein
MPPKKKGNKKAQNDDWEAELGESVAPQDGAASEPQPEDAAAADEDVAGGGLMAALAKRGKKKNKKGANLEVEGEDPPVDDANGDFDSKAPQEGTFDDDDDDVFAGNYGKKKGKGGAAAKTEEPVEEKTTDDAPRVKTKAEKEKEKKEKEKQRKKELVRIRQLHCPLDECVLTSIRLRRRRPLVLPKPNLRSLPRPSQLPLPHLRPLHQLQMPRPLLEARRRSSILRWLPYRSNRKSARREKRRWRVLRPKRKPG